ncbi:MAG: hypothetical protein ACLFVS_03215 [Candidatus Acetothermia bacterium]
MNKKFLVVIVLLVLSVAAGPSVLAGPADPLRGHEGEVAEIVGLIDGGEKETALEKLDSLHAAVVEARAELNGWVFEGSSGKRLTDPFVLPEGTYRVHFTTEGFGSVKVMFLEKDSWDLLFNLSPGKASEGASALYRSGGETIIVQISNITEPYKLVFEKLG